MKFFLLAFLLGQAAQAVIVQSLQKNDVLCSFTEPFLTVRYSPIGRTIELAEDNLDDQPNIQGATSQSTSVPGEVLVISHDRQIVLSLIQDGKGSNGMSDDIYPISAKLTTRGYLPLTYQQDSPQVRFDLFGGCRFN
jgi:uncharacterized membrane protein